MKIWKIPVLLLMLTAVFASCQKEFSLEGANIKQPAGSWQFNDSSTLYKGNMDTAYIDSSGPTRILHLKGTSLDGTQTFSLQLFSTDSFKVGTYKASLFQSEFQYYTTVKTLYLADQLAGEFVVNITVLSNNTITGTFAGIAQDSTSVLKNLTLGQFTSTIKLTSGGGGGSTVAVGTLGVTAGACTPSTVSGTYTQSVALTPANTVQIQVNVTTPGTYNINTAAVNGVSFSTSGSFAATGVQNVTLIGAGTPTSAGVQVFTVSFGTSTCTFPVTFVAGTPPPPVTDYFPITVGSNWAYGRVGGVPADSLLYKVIAYAPTVSSNTYATFTIDNIPPTINPDSAYYRKVPGSDYFEYSDLSFYFAYDAPVMGEFSFLKNAPVNTSWFSGTITGTRGGVPASGVIKMTILAQAVSATVGTLNFPDVIKVKYEIFDSTVPGVPFRSDERWFAKGIGLVKNSSISGFAIYEIGRYTVL